MLGSETMPEPIERVLFPVRYDEARRLILEDNDLDAAIGCLCQARPEDRDDAWLRTDMLAAALFARGRYRHCLLILRSHNGRYPGDPRVQLAIRIVAAQLTSTP